MKYLSILALIAIPLAASADKLRVDTTYDNPALPADELTCYDSYLSPKGYTIIGDVLSYPNMAGYSKIANASSPFCGACISVSFGNNIANLRVVDGVRGLDNSTPGDEASDPTLTIPSLVWKQLLEIDEIGPDQFLDVQALQVDSSACDPELHKKCVDC